MKMTDYENYVEEVYDWANNYNYYSHLVVKSNTSFALINQQGVTEQRIQQGSNHTQHDKYFIPQMKKYRVSITQTFKISQTFTPNFSIKSYVSKTRKPIKTSSKACWNWSQCSHERVSSIDEGLLSLCCRWKLSGLLDRGQSKWNRWTNRYFYYLILKKRITGDGGHQKNFKHTQKTDKK